MFKKSFFLFVFIALIFLPGISEANLQFPEKITCSSDVEGYTPATVHKIQRRDFSAERALHRSTIYVDSSATGSNNGTSWDDAYTDLIPAIDAATSGDHIWVAAGTYNPTVEGDTTYIYLKNGVEIYGGFAGWETMLEERDIEANTTILSADMNGDDIPGDFTTNRDDNTYHVCIVDSTIDNSAILDGFTISGGNTLISSGNYEDQEGGGIRSLGAPTISNCTFTQNKAYGGGGIMAYAPIVVSNCHFHNNLADYGGGILYFTSSAATISNCTFEENESTIYGGGVYTEQTESVTISNCTFMANNAIATGGGIYNLNSIEDEYNIIIQDCTFDENTADIAGAIANYGNLELTITNTSFNNNEATGPVGGAITLAYSSETGIAANADIQDCEFTGNISNDSGGAIFNHGVESHFLNCIFTGNSAPNNSGGAIYNGNSGVNSITENCEFYENSALMGGAYLNYGDCNPIIKNCIFANNEAGQYGGGVTSSYETIPDFPEIQIINSLFYDNSSGESGGGVALAGDFGSVINCTFSGNSAALAGGGIAAQGSGASVINSICWDNTAAMSDQIADLETQGFTVTYSLVQDGYTGEGNITGDPLFVDSEGNDYQLQEDSPAIDAGTTGENIPEIDLLGNPRDENPDMGAYEYLDPADIDVTDNLSVPQKAILHQNYPNPFNPTTTIEFEIPQTSKGLKTFEVSIRIYDTSGKLVKSLVNEPMEPGYHSVIWDGRDDNGQSVNSGMYIYKMMTDSYHKTRRCVMLK